MKIRRMKTEDYDQVYELWIHTPGMGSTIWMIPGKESKGI